MTVGREPPRLMLVTDRRRSRRPLPELVAAAVAGGVDAVQVREPDLCRAGLHDLAARLAEIVAGRARLLINGDAALAVALGVGLHLPERASESGARGALGAGRLLGRSVHSPEAAAADADADYLLAGHVFATPSKPGRRPLGRDGLARIVAAARVPVLAIGGITAEGTPAALAAGAAGVAVIGAVADAVDPARAALALRRAVDRRVEDEMQTETHAVATATVTVNGKAVEVGPGTTVTDFLAGKGLRGGMVIVELNGEILARDRYDATVFAPGDRVEMVHAVGGG